MSGQSYGYSSGFRVLGTPSNDLTGSGVLLEVTAGAKGFTVTKFGLIIVETNDAACVLTLARNATPTSGTGTDLVKFTVPISATVGDVHAAHVKPYGEVGTNLGDIMDIPPGQSALVYGDAAPTTTGDGEIFIEGYEWPSGSLKVDTSGEDIVSPSAKKLYNYTAVAA